ncbi:MAG TPA: hypothetical protein VMU45_11930 [Candidatus Eisenbacteria bacterium]|nr:hypothetical protein [Anaerolineales bacterium]HVP55693.1 hypothetical protein [Candidatus Eisenbacteria bacterium]
MSPQLAVFIVVVLAIVGWFALGTHLNIRKGHRYLEWLQAGLPLAGEKTTLHWLGSSVVQLKIDKAREPFRRVEVLVVLEPRDVPPLWLLSRLRGRRDLLIVRTELRFVPRSQFEILDRQAWSTQAVERDVLQLQWQLTPSGDLPFQVYALTPLAGTADLIAEVTHPELQLVRIGARRTANALEVQWRLPSRPLTSSRTVFESVHRLARRV